MNTIASKIRGTALALGALLAYTLATAAIAAPSEYGYRVVASYPHSRALFTQGLEYRDGLLYESAGLRGQSRLLVRSLDQLEPIRQHWLARDIFAEGLTLLDGKIYQLSWRAGRGFIYSADTLAAVAEFAIDGEGWGLCNNGRELIISNGSAELQFIDAGSFNRRRVLTVRDGDTPVDKLNELEWVDGQIYANIWQRDEIVIIDPHSGQLSGRIDLRGLLPERLRRRDTDVLNGIAWDAAQQRLLVTGKRWPLLYQLELIPRQH